MTDFSRLESIAGGDDALRAELIDLFEQSAANNIAIMEQELEAEDTQAWGDAAHQLRGAASNLGFDNMADLCAQAQQEVDAGVLQKIIGARDAIIQKLKSDN